MLNQVERGAFALEKGAGLALDFGNNISLAELVAVVLVDGRLKALRLQDSENAQRDIDAAENAVVLGEKARFVFLVLVDEVVGGGVEVVDVLEQRC